MLYNDYTDQEAGNKFESEILAELRRTKNIWVHPLSDTRSASRGSDVRFINPQPSDFASVVTGGKSLYLEAKASRVHSGLEECTKSEIHGLIRKNQSTAARQVYRMGGYYVFIFLDRTNHRVKAYDGNNVALYYMGAITQIVEPIIDELWAGRSKFCQELINTIIERDNHGC